MNNRPPPAGIYRLIFFILWAPLFIGLMYLYICGVTWLLRMIQVHLGDAFGEWMTVTVFGGAFLSLAIIAYRSWRWGLLPYQRRQTENLHRELGLPPPVWPADIQAKMDADAEAKRLKQEIKDKWSQPGPRIPPMNGPTAPRGLAKI